MFSTNVCRETRELGRVLLEEVGQNARPCLCSVKNQQTGEEEKRTVLLYGNQKTVLMRGIHLLNSDSYTIDV